MAGTLTPRLRALLQEATRAAGVPFVLFQGSYSTSVGASAGTHSGGGAFDLDIRMMNHTQRLHLVDELRRRDCAAWIRTPEYGYHAPPEHIHGICWTEPGLSAAAAAQVRAYQQGRNGLADNGPDPHPKPAPRDEDDVTPEDIDRIVDRTATEVMRRLEWSYKAGEPKQSLQEHVSRIRRALDRGKA